MPSFNLKYHQLIDTFNSVNWSVLHLFQSLEYIFLVVISFDESFNDETQQKTLTNILSMTTNSCRTCTQYGNFGSTINTVFLQFLLRRYFCRDTSDGTVRHVLTQASSLLKININC